MESCNHPSTSYSYQNGALFFDSTQVELQVLPNEKKEGKFSIHTDSLGGVEGNIFVTDWRIKCPCNHFDKKSMEISFLFDAAGLEQGRKVYGEFIIISNLGEFYLPYEVTVCGKAMDSTMGKIHNLFHFTNLARKNWMEARTLFASDSFEALMVGSNRQFLSQYRGLVSLGKENDQLDYAMDQFLIMTRKKSPVTFSIEEKNYVFSREMIPEKLSVKIRRNGWGYTRLRVAAQASFLSIADEKTCVLQGEQFANDFADVEIQLAKESVGEYGGNGSILFQDEDGNRIASILIEIKAAYGKDKLEQRQKNQFTDCMMRLYLDYRAGFKSKQETIETGMNLLEHVTGKEQLMPQLYQAHGKLLAGQMNEAGWILKNARRMISGKELPMAIYGYFLYLTAMSGNENSERASELLVEYQSKYPDCFVIYWANMNMNQLNFTEPGEVMRKLLHYWEKGEYSPVLYMEAGMILRDNPMLLEKLDSFRIQLLLFMDRYELMTPFLVEQFYELIPEVKKYSGNIVKLMKRYQPYDRKTIVKCMCLQIMRGSKKGSEAAGWLAEGIEKDCHITKLYEAYIYALDFDKDAKFPEQVNRYFSYDCSMDDTQLAYVYCKVLKSEWILPPDYENKIRIFALEELAEGRLDENLAYIYRRVLQKEDLMPKHKKQIIRMVTTCRLEVKEPRLKSCLIVQKHFLGKEQCPIVDGMATIHLMEPDFTPVFEKENGEPVICENRYQLHPLLGIEVLDELVGEIAEENIAYCFYIISQERIEEADTPQKRKKAYYRYRMLLGCGELELGYRKMLAGKLLSEISGWDEENYILEFLKDAEKTDFLSEDWEQFVKMLVFWGFYEKAFDTALTCEPEHFDARVLAKIAQFTLKERENEYDEELLSFVYASFRNGKYTQDMISYLVNYFHGTVKQLRDIWKAAVSLETDATKLAGRVIDQLLCSGAYTSDRQKIFEYYYRRGGSRQIIGRYLSMCAEEYIVRGQDMEPDIFAMEEERLREGESLSLCEQIALLKYFSEKFTELTREEKAFIPEMLSNSLASDIYFPYYHCFTPLYPVIEVYEEKNYVEYHTTPGTRVVIHYILDRGESDENVYYTEEMKEIYPGIFQKDFIVFWGDRLQYYITEESAGHEEFILSRTLELSENTVESNQGRFKQLNTIALSMELQDYLSVEKMIEEYSQTEFLGKELFSLR